MNAVAFTILAVLIVGAALGCVVLPRLRDAGGALILALVAIAILCVASGQYIVAAALLAAAGTAAVAVRALVPLDRTGDVPAAALLTRDWWVALAVALGFGALLATVLALSGGGFVSGDAAPAPASVLGGREPYALVIAVVLVVAGAGVALLLGRTGDDERAADAREAARRSRDERMRARREAREAARRARREAAAPRSGGG